MKTDKTFGSSLTFNIRDGRQIQEIINLIKDEAKKVKCAEAEITLIATAVSEVCRRFMEHTSFFELTISLLTHSWGIELQGKATSNETAENAQLQEALNSLNTYYFNDMTVRSDKPADKLMYEFNKKITYS